LTVDEGHAGLEMDLLRANTASLRSSLALMKHRCVGMEPDAVIQDPALPSKGKTEAEKIWDMFANDGGVYEGIDHAEAGIKEAVKKGRKLWPELDKHVSNSAVLLNRCELVGRAMAMEVARQDKRQSIHTFSRSSSSLEDTQGDSADMSAHDAATQTVEEEKQGPTKYWTQGFELELQALRLANATRLAEAGLEHKDLKTLVGESVQRHINQLRDAGQKHAADAVLFQQLAHDMGQTVKGLVAEREKMLALIHTLSCSYSQPLPGAHTGKVVNVAVQTDSTEGQDDLDNGGSLNSKTSEVKVGEATLRVPSQWKNLLKITAKPGAPKMPLPVMARIVREVLQEMRRVVRDNAIKPFPDLVFEYFTFKFGLKTVAETRLKDLISASIEYQTSSELARIFTSLAGLLDIPYEQDAVMLLSTGYDALEMTTDGSSNKSRAWFELGYSARVILSDCLFVKALRIRRCQRTKPQSVAGGVQRTLCQVD